MGLDYSLRFFAEVEIRTIYQSFGGNSVQQAIHIHAASAATKAGTEFALTRVVSVFAIFAAGYADPFELHEIILSRDRAAAEELMRRCATMAEQAPDTKTAWAIFRAADVAEALWLALAEQPDLAEIAAALEAAICRADERQLS